MTEAKNIFEKMLRIQSEIPTVAKNLNVQTGGYGSYKAVSERDVKDAVKPLEDKYGVYSYPISKELIEQSFLETATQKGTRKSFFIREKVTYRFVNVSKPDEFIDIVGYGDGIDTGDKAPGKADTYAGKYCLMSAYKISTGDDPDKDASQEYTARNVDDLPQVLDEFNKVRADMSAAGMDIHDEKIAEYICMKADIKTVDPGKLDYDGLKRAVSVMQMIIKAKK